MQCKVCSSSVAHAHHALSLKEQAARPIQHLQGPCTLYGNLTQTHRPALHQHTAPHLGSRREEKHMPVIERLSL